MAAWCCMGLCFGEEAGARNLVFFRVKWLQPAMKGTWSVRRLRLGSVCPFFLPQCNGGLKLLWVCLCVCAWGCRSYWNGCMTLVIWCSGVVLCVDRCKFASWCCEPHCNGCMMLHGAMFGQEAGARNLAFFPCKMAAAGDERYLVCAAVAAGVGLSFFFLPQCNGGLKLLWCACVCVCVVVGCFGISGCRSYWNGCMTLVIWCSGVVLCVDRCKFASWCCEPHCNGCMMLHGAMFWGGSRSTKPCVFLCKVAAAGDERYLVCAAVAAGVGLSFFFSAV